MQNERWLLSNHQVDGFQRAHIVTSIEGNNIMNFACLISSLYGMKKFLTKVREVVQKYIRLSRARKLTEDGATDIVDVQISPFH